MGTKEKTLQLFLRGDKKTIEEMYDKIYPTIRRYVLKNSGREADAEDMFQEALVVLYRKLKEGELALSCSLATYIYSISRNIWLDRLRRAQRQAPLNVDEVEFVELNEDVLQTIHENERNLIFQKHFNTLAVQCQKVLKLFFEGSSMKEISEELGYKNEEYARKKKYLCKKNLISNIKKDPSFKELAEGYIKPIHAIK